MIPRRKNAHGSGSRERAAGGNKWSRSIAWTHYAPTVARTLAGFGPQDGWARGAIFEGFAAGPTMQQGGPYCEQQAELGACHWCSLRERIGVNPGARQEARLGDRATHAVRTLTDACKRLFLTLGLGTIPHPKLVSARCSIRAFSLE